MTEQVSYPSSRDNKGNSMLERAFNRFGWLIVMSAALGFSTWSLYYIARHYGAPAPAAVVVSMFFDGAAVLCADYSLKYARTGDSGFIPQLGVFTLAGLSAYLNSQHAQLNHDPSAARILFAAPPIVAVVIYEFHVRWERRRALRNSGRIPAVMPVFGRYAWFLFPLRTIKVLRSITAGRLAMIHATNTPGMFIGGSPEYAEPPSGFTETTPEFALPATMPGNPPGLYVGSLPGTPAMVRAWARSVGIQVNPRGPIPIQIQNAYDAALTQFRAAKTKAEIESAPIEPATPENDPNSSNIREGYL